MGRIISGRWRLAWALLAAAFWSVTAVAQPVETQRVRPPAPGPSITIGAGALRGHQVVDYVVPLQAGQRVVFAFRPTNPSAYMNVSAPGAAEALHVGSRAGNRFETVTRSRGDYVIRVYLMRNAARRGETSRYTLSLQAIGGGVGGAPPPEYADGVSGGPDYWRVTRAPQGRLGLFAETSPRSRLLTNLAEGVVVRNRECRMLGGQKWCRLETLDQRYRGWALGAYLREGAPPRPPALPYPRPPPLPKVFIGGNGEGEVVFEGNNCVAYYDRRGARRSNNANCMPVQVIQADEAMARYRREQGIR